MIPPSLIELRATAETLEWKELREVGGNDRMKASPSERRLVGRRRLSRKRVSTTFSFAQIYNPVMTFKCPCR